MNPRKMTSSFSKREKIRRNPFKRRNSRSISLRRLYISRSYSQGWSRLRFGGTTGVYPSAKANWRVSSPSYARSMSRQSGAFCLPRRFSSLRPSGASWAWRGKRERYGRSSIRGNHMNLGGPAAAGLADGLRAVFFRAPVPSGCTLTAVLSIDNASSLMRTIRSRCKCSNTRSSTPFFGQRFIRV